MGGFSGCVGDEVAPFGVKVCTLEPRHPDELGASRRPERAGTEESVGRIFKPLRSIEGRSEGDSRKLPT